MRQRSASKGSSMAFTRRCRRSARVGGFCASCAKIQLAQSQTSAMALTGLPEPLRARPKPDIL